MTVQYFKEQAIRAERLTRAILVKRASEARMGLARDMTEGRCLLSARTNWRRCASHNPLRMTTDASFSPSLRAAAKRP